jgi:threonine synthase
LNAALVALECYRCGERFPPAPMLLECPVCSVTAPSNVFCVYDYDAVAERFDPAAVRERPPTLWRYAELLPVAREHAVSLGEGATPMVRLERLGRRLGLDSLHLKDESQNPTWSFKDRLASLGASKARELGSEVLTVASSGNAGAAVAAYAAQAGLRAVVLTSRSAPLPMRVLMEAYGAHALAPDDMAQRGALVRVGVERYGWFPVQNFKAPPVGANPFAIEGCKAIAFEICEQLGWRVPAAVVFPITNGDSLAGAWRGFCDLRALGLIDAIPRLYGAEVHGPVARTLEDGLELPATVTPDRASVAISAASRTTAYQVLRAIRETGGWSVAVADDDEILAAQRELAREEGIYAEASSVLGLAVLARLLDSGAIDRREEVVLVSTSGGLKDFDLTLGEPRPVPHVGPDEAGLVDGLARHYGYRARPLAEAIR